MSVDDVAMRPDECGRLAARPGRYVEVLVGRIIIVSDGVHVSDAVLDS